MISIDKSSITIGIILKSLFISKSVIPKDSSFAFMAQIHSYVFHVLQGNRGRKSACNAWLVEELETAPYVESEDALSYIFRARAEELLRDYTAGDHQGRTKAINPNDSFDTAGMLDESPDSLDELLDSYYRDGGQCTCRIGFKCEQSIIFRSFLDSGRNTLPHE